MTKETVDVGSCIHVLNGRKIMLLSVVEPETRGVVIYCTSDERVVGMVEVVSALEAERVMSDSL